MMTMGWSDWWGDGVVCLVGKGGGTSLREDLGVDISAVLHRITGEAGGDNRYGL